MELKNWSDELVSGDHLTEAIALCDLWVQTYPESMRAHISLGEVYQRARQPHLAVQHYNWALERDPHNRAIRNELKKRFRELESRRGPTSQVDRSCLPQPLG